MEVHEAQTVKKDFLISYAENNKDWAEWISWYLEEQGYAVSIDIWDYLPGHNRIYERDRALRQAEQILIVYSNYYQNTLYAQPEWTNAFQKHLNEENRKVFVLCIDGCEREGLLSTIIPIELVGLDVDSARQRLLDGLKGVRKKPVQEPRYPGWQTTFFGIVPERNPLFVGRELVLKQLQSTLQQGAAAAITHSLSAGTVGSIGKTEVAKEYLHRYRYNYDFILWVQDSSSDTEATAMRNSIQRIVQDIGIISESDAPGEVSALLQDWLQQHENWLLVVDDLSHPSRLEPLLPSQPKGHLLITTRDRSVATYTQLIELQDLTPEEREATERLSHLFKAALRGTDNTIFTLQPGRTTIGSNPGNNIVINDETVSDVHAIIEHTERGLVLIDQGSDYGTQVNGQRITPHTPYQLNGEMQIKLGNYLLAAGIETRPILETTATWQTEIDEISLQASDQQESTDTTAATTILQAEPEGRIDIEPPQPSLPRIEDVSSILQQAAQHATPDDWKVMRALPLAFQTLSLPEPLLSIFILTLTFFLVCVYFSYLCWLADLGSITILSFYVTICTAIILFFMWFAIAIVRKQQRAQLPYDQSSSDACLIILPEGVVEYLGTTKNTLIVFSFADLKTLYVKQEERLNIAWLELSYRDGHQAMWQPGACFGMPLDVCNDIFLAYTRYTNHSYDTAP